MILNTGNKLFTRRAIAGFLVLAVLMLALSPVHYHLHHAPGSDDAHAEHLIDLHYLMDSTGSVHHQDAHSIEPASDAALKSPGVLLPLLALIVTWLLLVSPRPAAIGLSASPVHAGRPRLRRHSSPPLRAPPRC